MRPSTISMMPAISVKDCIAVFCRTIRTMPAARVTSEINSATHQYGYLALLIITVFCRSMIP